MPKRNKLYVGKISLLRVKEIANKKMTLKEAIKWATSKGLVLKKDEAGDYVIKIKGAREETTYFTDDLADALATGEHMLKELDKLGKKVTK